MGLFAEGIGTGAATPALFGAVHCRGRRWEAESVSGSTISDAKLTYWNRDTEGVLDLTLVVNPIRTLAHLLDWYEFDEFGDLSPAEFFTARPSPSAASQTLDGKDNMLPDFLAFGSSVHSTQLQRVATYLSMFEEALKGYVRDQLCPPGQGYETGEQDGAVWAWNDDFLLRLDWGDLTLSQCEVCWERHDERALEAVHRLADGILLAARSASVTTHPLGPRTEVNRDLGALSVRAPLVPSKINLVVYAKAASRLRFEVRYTKDLPDNVRRLLPPAPRRLTDWFDVVRENAAGRVRWDELYEMLTPAPQPTLDALAELLAAVADATDKAKAKREGLLRELLLHGALTATNRDGAAPVQVVERLRKRGIVEHVRLTNKDAKIGRRYRLTSRFLGLAQQTC